MILIKTMTQTDIPNISELLCSCYRWLGEKNKFTQEQIDFLVNERGCRKIIKIESQEQTYLAAFSENTIAGMVAVKKNEVAKLFVNPEHHSKGIGTKLFQNAEQIIHDSGYIEMIVGVMAHSAIGFYQKMGMQKYDEKLIDSGAFSGCRIPLMKKFCCPLSPQKQ